MINEDDPLMWFVIIVAFVAGYAIVGYIVQRFKAQREREREVTAQLRNETQPSSERDTRD